MKTNAKKLQGERTRAGIQEAAKRLFVAQGFSGTALSDISACLGLTKGALYAHFSSKDELLLSLIRRWETDFLDSLIAEVLSTPGDASAKLNRLVSFNSEFAARDRDLCLLVAKISSELQGSDNGLAREVRRLYDTRARFVTRLVEEGKAQGVFDSALDARTLAYVIIAFHDGVLLEWHRTGETLKGPDFVRAFRRVLLFGVLPRPAEAETERSEVGGVR